MLSNENEKIINFWLETVSYRTHLLRAKLPIEYKFACSLGEFKREIEHWNCESVSDVHTHDIKILGIFEMFFFSSCKKIIKLIKYLQKYLLYLTTLHVFLSLISTS